MPFLNLGSPLNLKFNLHLSFIGKDIKIKRDFFLKLFINRLSEKEFENSSTVVFFSDNITHVRHR